FLVPIGVVRGEDDVQSLPELAGETDGVLESDGTTVRADHLEPVQDRYPDRADVLGALRVVEPPGQLSDLPTGVLDVRVRRCQPRRPVRPGQGDGLEWEADREDRGRESCRDSRYSGDVLLVGHLLGWLLGVGDLPRLAARWRGHDDLGLLPELVLVEVEVEVDVERGPEPLGPVGPAGGLGARMSESRLSSCCSTFSCSSISRISSSE